MQSKLEQKICSWFPKETIVENSRELIGGKEIDIYFPKHKLAVEVDGVRWHTEFNGRGLDYHNDKLISCLNKGIRLMNVYDYEVKKHQELVKDAINRELKQLFTLNAKFVKVGQVDPEDALKFIEENYYSYTPCEHKHYVGFSDKRGTCLVVCFRLENVVELGEQLVVTDVVFRKGLHILNWPVLVTKHLTSCTGSKGLVFAIQATVQPCLVDDLVKSGYKVLGLQRGKHSWFKNGKIYKDVDDPTTYTRVFPYGYILLSGGDFTKKVDFRSLGFTLKPT